MLQSLIRFLREEDGQDILEYSLLLVLLGGVAIIYLYSLNFTVKSIFTKVSTRLASAP